MASNKWILTAGLIACIFFGGCNANTQPASSVGEIGTDQEIEDEFIQAGLATEMRMLRTMAQSAPTDTHPDILSPDHPLSQNKPSLEPTPLKQYNLVKDDPHQISLDQSVYELPIDLIQPPQYQNGGKIAFLAGSDYALTLGRMGIEEFSYEDTLKRLSRRANTPDEIRVLEAIRSKLEKDKELPIFDRFAAILSADVKTSHLEEPLGARFLRTYRFCAKAATLFQITDSNEPIRYYTGDNLRAFVCAPMYRKVQSPDPATEETQITIETVTAYVSFNGENRLCGLTFMRRADNGSAIPTEFVEDFLSKCSLKQVYTALPPVETAPAAIKFTVKETLVGEIKGHLQFSPHASSDGKHTSYLRKEGEKVVEVIDGHEGKPYDEVDYGGYVTFSEGGNHYSYIAKENGKKIFVIDGKESESYAEVFWEPTFSPDGNRYAYMGGGWIRTYFMLDGNITVQNYAGDGFCWSNDSKHWAYRALNRDDSSFIIADGTEHKDYKHVGEPVFTPRDNKLSYAAASGKNDLLDTLILDGEILKKYEDGSTIVAHTFTNGSSKLVELLKDQEGKFVIAVDNVRGKKYDDITWYNLELSKTNDGFAYLAQSGRENIVVWNGLEIGRYERLNDYEMPANLCMSSDDKHLAYTVCHEGNSTMVLDGETKYTCDEISRFVAFSPDGKRYAFHAKRNGKAFAVIDGQEETSSYSSIARIYFSPDSRHYAYQAATAGGGYILDVTVVDGVEVDHNLSVSQLEFDGPDSLRTVVCALGDLVLLNISIEPK